MTLLRLISAWPITTFLPHELSEQGHRGTGAIDRWRVPSTCHLLTLPCSLSPFTPTTRK